MIFQSQGIENFAIALPITQKSRQIALQFAAQQPPGEKTEQVLLNTLAVLVVNTYLSMLEIPTDLANSDSWNRVMQVSNNVADLEIPGVGKLECRPIKSSVDQCSIPLEVRNSSIGYVVVRIDDELRKATILGFAPEITTKELAVADLHPPEELIDHLHDLQESSVDDSLTYLAQWFNDIFETGWEKVESLLTPQQLTPILRFRSIELLEPASSEFQIVNNRVSRAKLINLGIKFNNRNIILLIEIQPEENGSIAVKIQIHPDSRDLYLPEALELKIIESSDTVFMQVQARNRDNYIQLQFSGEPGEIFGVKIILDEINFYEKFKL